VLWKQKDDRAISKVIHLICWEATTFWL